ncbi:hypothetical protein F5Y12DRAFT_755557 [Xylaria sp. FL1777]|nr:hypothetical protein F5Y12DRAFT_755557 [Xylaria sp. FL1777]
MLRSASHPPPLGDATSECPRSYCLEVSFHSSYCEILMASSPTKDIHVQSSFDLCRSFPARLCATIDGDSR